MSPPTSAQLLKSFARFISLPTLSKCCLVATSIRQRTGQEITTHRVDADNLDEAIALLRNLSPDLLLNLALPYQNLTLMEACLATGTNYLDTANYESPEIARFEYKWQWQYHERFQEKNLCALLGSGFDPGVTNVSPRSAQNIADEISSSILSMSTAEKTTNPLLQLQSEINIRKSQRLVVTGRRPVCGVPSISLTALFPVRREWVI